MRIALGADHGGYQLKNIILDHLKEQGYETLDLGTNSDESVDYPKFAFAVGQAVRENEADLGILVCGTGIGVSMTANKIPGIRAAVCTDTYCARMTREHNDANILALGARVVGSGLALDIVDAFLKTEFAGGRHARRVDMMAQVEQGKKL